MSAETLIQVLASGVAGGWCPQVLGTS